ncbi:formate hydrogenlyase maturation HycH family protein [Sulfurospirillum arcachonense]|uniref:formate hydrogenlyase maturation HycH family protein n=1 Tax=Sulfurospirillum arcachonense TaxID=57666 RepID=UPI000467EEA8|nr:formate hydrogenlyase maturation HycH family protein [Sulfurospirillum arcachonense]
MIEICRLTKRLVDPNENKLPDHLEQIKVFSMAVGHGIGTVDFVECIDKIEEDEYLELVESCGEYAKFKLGNLSRYFEIEVFPEHAEKLVHQMPDCKLKEYFLELQEGFIVIRKSI